MRHVHCLHITVYRLCSAVLFPVNLSDLPTATRTGDSERQETASTAASEEAGQANLLAVTRRNLTLDIIAPRRSSYRARRSETTADGTEKPVSSSNVNIYGLNMSRENVNALDFSHKITLLFKCMCVRLLLEMLYSSFVQKSIKQHSR